MTRSFVYGVGVNDCPGWTRDKTKDSYEWKVYTTWKDMLRRCYDSKYQEKYPTYKGCSVCREWHTLSKFAEDIKLLPNYDRYIQGTHKFLDKDIIVPGNKVYSPRTCMFVTPTESIIDVLSNHPR